MPIEGRPEAAAAEGRSLAQQRIIRYAVGTAIGLGFSQMAAWDHSYLAAVFAATFLGLPIPAPRLKGGISFVVVLAAAVLLGLLVLLPLNYQALAGVLLLTLLFYLVFLRGLRGGNPLVGALAIVGLAVIPIVGVISVPAAIVICEALLKAGVVALLILWLAHALFPDPPVVAGSQPKVAAPQPDTAAAGRLAARSTLVVMPVIGWLLATGGTSYIGMAIKVASMGQQVSTDSTRQAGYSLLASTLIGGVAAIAVWLVLRIWPSLLLYVLLVLLVGLVMGKRIFAGAAYTPTGPVWTYAYVTMLIILGPAVLDSGDAAGARFFDRIMMFVWATVYSMFAVWFFDGIMRTRAIKRARRRLRRGSRAGDVAGEAR
jgi:hypothetical protein